MRTYRISFEVELNQLEKGPQLWLTRNLGSVQMSRISNLQVSEKTNEETAKSNLMARNRGTGSIMEKSNASSAGTSK